MTESDNNLNDEQRVTEFLSTLAELESVDLVNRNTRLRPRRMVPGRVIIAAAATLTIGAGVAVAADRLTDDIPTNATTLQGTGGQLSCSTFGLTPAAAEDLLAEAGFDSQWRVQSFAGVAEDIGSEMHAVAGETEAVDGPPESGVVYQVWPMSGREAIAFVVNPDDPNTPQLEQPANCGRGASDPDS